MSETLLRMAAVSPPARMPRRTRPETGAAARGIMLALALSSIAWVGVALLVPRLW